MKIVNRTSNAVRDTMVVLGSPECTFEPGAAAGSVVQTNAQCAFIALQGANKPSFDNAYIYRPSDTTRRWTGVYERACHASPAPFPIDGSSWDAAATPWQGSPHLFIQPGAQSNATFFSCVVAATNEARIAETAGVASGIYGSHVMAAVVLPIVGCIVGGFVVHKAVVTKPWRNLSLPFVSGYQRLSDDAPSIEIGSTQLFATARTHHCWVDDYRELGMFVSPLLGMLAGVAVGAIFPENTSYLYAWGLIGGAVGGPALAGALVWANWV